MNSLRERLASFVWVFMVAMGAALGGVLSAYLLIFALGGQKLLSQMWSDEPVYGFLAPTIFAGIVGIWAGFVLFGRLWRVLMTRTGFLSDQKIREMWKSMGL